MVKRQLAFSKTRSGGLCDPDARDGIVAVAGVYLFADLFFLHFKHGRLRPRREHRQRRTKPALRVPHINGVCDLGSCFADNLCPVGQHAALRKATRLCSLSDAFLHQGHSTRESARC